MAVCKTCGSVVHQGDSFCPVCGQGLFNLFGLRNAECARDALLQTLRRGASEKAQDGSMSRMRQRKRRRRLILHGLRQRNARRFRKRVRGGKHRKTASGFAAHPLLCRKV